MTNQCLPPKAVLPGVPVDTISNVPSQQDMLFDASELLLNLDTSRLIFAMRGTTFNTDLKPLIFKPPGPQPPSREFATGREKSAYKQSATLK